MIKKYYHSKIKQSFSKIWLFRFMLIVVFSAARTWAVKPYKPQLGDPLLEQWRWHKIPELTGKGIRCMMEDKDKSMWFGTEQGVMHYDGVNWTAYASDDSLLGMSVFGLLKSRDGKIYASTRHGISCFEGGRWEEIFSYSATYTGFWRVSSLIETSDGSIWVGLPYGALRIKDSEFVFYTEKSLSESVKKIASDVEIILVSEKESKYIADFGVLWNHIYNIFEDREGNIWFGFFNGEILKYTPPDNWYYMYKSDEKPQISQTMDGRIWVISDAYNIEYSGPLIYDSAADTDWHYIDLESIGGNHNNCSFLQAGDGSIWIGGFGNFHILKNGNWHIYDSSNLHIPISMRVFFYESSDGSIWIYEHQKDVYRVEYKDYRWKKYLGLNFQFETEDGLKWFIASDNGVICQHDGTWIRYGTEDGLIDSPSALLCTRNGEVWVSGSHNLNAATAIFDGKRWHRKVHDKVSWGLDYRAAFEALDGALYFGSAIDRMYNRRDSGGMLKYSPFEKDTTKAWTLFVDPIIVHSAIYGIGQTADSTIWLGRKGLVKFYNEGNTEIVDHIILNSSYVECIENSKSNHLWVGTRSYGVFYYNGEIWENYTVEKNGLMSNTIVSLLPTSDTTAWAATDEDICYFDGNIWVTKLFPEQMTMTREGGTLKMSRDGTLWINKSSRRWFRRARQKSYFTKEIYPDYYTIAYLPDGLAPETEITVYEEKISQPGNAVFTWRGIDPWKMTPDDKLQYSYRIDEGEWSQFNYEINHIFLSLSSGKHIFEVKARDQDLNTDPTPASIKFEVLPPVWRHPLMITTEILFFLVVSFLIVNIVRRDKRMNKMNIALLKANKSIKASLNEKEVLLKEIHHRVKNNLQVVSSLLNLQSQHIQDKKALDMFKDSQDRVRSMAMVHEKLYQSSDLSKIDAGEYIESLTNSLYRSYRIKSKNVELKLETGNIFLSIDLAVPCGLIVNELVSNALKHAFPAKWKGSSKVEVSCFRDDNNYINLIIYDNGVGLPKNIDWNSSDSFGLQLVSILVEDQLQGEIKLDRNSGTKFQIRFKELRA